MTALCGLVTLSPAIAQVVPDATLPVNSQVTPAGNTNVITGGTQAGNNLFHSFEQFSIPTGSQAHFDNSLGIQNVISRVTGGSISNIDGLIRANGTANLFLLNPNGIIFGPNASLDIRGSFLASTANSIKFADGTQFSATPAQTTPLLTINVPTGLQFGQNTGSIRYQSQAINEISGESVGLQVLPGRTLALVGGNVQLDGGRLVAPNAQVKLGGVASSGTVRLNVDGNNLSLSFDDSITRADISLTNGALIDTSTIEDGSDIIPIAKVPTIGDIQVQGRDIQLSQNSKIFGAANIQVQGRDIRLSQDSDIKAASIDGNIQLQGRDIQLSQDSWIITSRGDIQVWGRDIQLSQGSWLDASIGGNIQVQAQDIQLSQNSNIFAGAGDIWLQGRDIQLSQNSGIITYFGKNQVQGRNIQLSQGVIDSIFGGAVTVEASESVEIIGIVPQSEASPSVPSRIATITNFDNKTENLIINTKRLLVRDGAQIKAFTQGSTSGGNLTINATESVKVIGTGILSNGELSPSQLIAASGFVLGAKVDSLIKPIDITGSGGNLSIDTGELIVKDGGQVSVNSETSGNAGDLEVIARSISLNNEGKLTAISENAQGGNIKLAIEDLLLMRRNSLISAESGITTGSNDGNIKIDAGVIAAIPVENSDIIAKAGQGGNIDIKAQGIFGIKFREQLTPESDITASGSTIFNIQTVDLSQKLTNLSTELIDASNQIAQGCSSGSGSMARGNKFVVVGRGGLPPTPKEALRGDVALADLGKPIEMTSTQARVIAPTNQKPLEQTPLVEAQGWVTGPQGEVILTASAPNVTPNIPWMKSNTCHG